MTHLVVFLVGAVGFCAVAVAVFILAAPVLIGRGETAEHPDQAEETLPAWQGCVLNATPHWCFQPPLVVSRDYPTTPAEQIFADAVENYLRTETRRIR